MEPKIIKLRQEGKDQERGNKKIEQEQNFTIGPSREGMSSFLRARPATAQSTPFQDPFHSKPSQIQTSLRKETEKESPFSRMFLVRLLHALECLYFF